MQNCSLTSNKWTFCLPSDEKIPIGMCPFLPGEIQFVFIPGRLRNRLKGFSIQEESVKEF